jgi:hypothetical protein
VIGALAGEPVVIAASTMQHAASRAAAEGAVSAFCEIYFFTSFELMSSVSMKPFVPLYSNLLSPRR